MATRPIASFFDWATAQRMRGMLESAGIRCFLANEHLLSVNNLYGPAVGGIELVVRDEDAEEASEMLAELLKLEAEPSDPG